VLRNNKIAYLAPEIPALSATFVYNEILSLQRKGFKISPISVHYPKSKALEKEVEYLFQDTFYLYDSTKWDLLTACLKVFILNPLKFVSVLFTAIRDSVKIGIGTRIGIGIIFRFFVSAKVVLLLRKNNCSHIHAHFAHVSTDIAMYASMLSGVSFSFTSHANDLFERAWLLKEKCSQASAVITISEFNKKFLIDKGVDPSKISIIRCGVKAIELKKEKYIVPDKEPITVIGSLGRLVEKKGLDTLINALSLIDSPFRLEIAGDGPLLNELEELTKKLNLSHKIFFKGAIPHDEVPQWLSHLDVFVLACKKDSNGDMDGIPVVLMESMLLGVPVISTFISGIPELIEDGVSGLLSQPDNNIMLSEKITTLIDNPQLSEFFSIAAARKIKKEFDSDLNVGRLIKVWKEQY